MSMSSRPFTPPHMTTVAGCVAEARAHIVDHAYLSQGRCVDWLLDCLNAAVRSSVRTVVTEKLDTIRGVTLVAGPAFADMLDEIHLALQVDAAFDHLELGHLEFDAV